MNDVMQPAQVPGAPSLPQVNLLPMHVRDKRKLAVVRVWLVLALLVVMLLTILAAVATLWEKQSAESEFVDVQNSNQILVQEATKYSEVTKVLRELDARESARTSAMSTETLWSPYLAAVSSVTPLEASIETFTVTQYTLWGGAPAQINGPLSTAGTVGEVSLTGRAQTLGATSAWQDGLSTLRGVVDVELSSVEIADTDGSVYYAVSATFKLTPEVFANQFVTEQ